MTPSEYKAKYDELKARATRAEGAREQLLSSLKKDFELDTIEEAASYLERLEGKLKDADEDIADLTKELEGVTDWTKL